MKFKIGDKVTLKDGYEYKDQQVGIGTICEIDRAGGFAYGIRWSDRSTNHYEEKGIVLHEKPDNTLQKLKEEMLQ